MSDKYRYFAIVDNKHGVDDPRAVVREWDVEGHATREEVFTRNLKWKQSDRLLRIRSGRDYEEAERISEEDVHKFIKTMTESVRNRE